MKLSGKTFIFIAGAIIVGGVLAALSSRYLETKITERKLEKAAAEGE
ncbi:hypothetical protein [Croceimicrobium hydrocarbonivorans]|uniref:Uncharacterized protein n=1 Tax=Croceimicrobium hydrocarbonivorans TaxID=2761580 RepID=A0A7H0VBA3_9FLAO|nr:hypothetical protein [Croceimicrobium hydrocarbonivorans]QNR22958.1 hypothetical protein H4K34_11270 [Croceimicrobium hydrocarbonivorans]QNR23001.1 hypothetical protein H4K34_11485 [Croceimicrobium hydrocarbonivorans]